LFEIKVFSFKQRCVNSFNKETIWLTLMVPEIKIGKESQKGPKMMKCVGQESSTKLVKVKNVVLVNMLQ
jgi:hypothetical protein